MEQNNNNNNDASKQKSKETKQHPFHANGPLDVTQFVEKTTELLNMEKDAEIDESLLQQVRSLSHMSYNLDYILRQNPSQKRSLSQQINGQRATHRPCGQSPSNSRSYSQTKH
jgi:hypothetical protein